jgi:sorbitol-specific phosphotransferase system component IIA
LQPYYKHSFFFESQALRHAGFVTVELDVIFRQTDGRFVDLLNALRNNTLQERDVDLLNAHYRTEAEVEAMEEVITLTTHNYRAEDINERALRELPGAEMRFNAHIEGEFPESIHPISDVLRLKEGAQVMFVRNDSSGQNRYYNGLLATVTSCFTTRR